MGAALSAAVPWARRRRHHARLTQALADLGAESAVIAEHWQAAGDHERARQEFVIAAESRCAVHAYRNAAALAGGR